MEKLLKPGGWVLFDDLRWSYASSPSMSKLDWVKELPEEVRTSQQIGAVFELLVRQQGNFWDLRREGSWGWARKGSGFELVERLKKIRRQLRAK